MKRRIKQSKQNHFGGNEKGRARELKVKMKMKRREIILLSAVKENFPPSVAGCTKREKLGAEEVSHRMNKRKTERINDCNCVFEVCICWKTDAKIEQFTGANFSSSTKFKHFAAEQQQSNDFPNKMGGVQIIYTFYCACLFFPSLFLVSI